MFFFSVDPLADLCLGGFSISAKKIVISDVALCVVCVQILYSAGFHGHTR